MDQYLPILLLVVLALLFAVGSFMASRMLGPKAGSTRPSAAPTSPASPPSASRPPASRCASTWWR